MTSSGICRIAATATVAAILSMAVVLGGAAGADAAKGGAVRGAVPGHSRGVAVPRSIHLFSPASLGAPATPPLTTVQTSFPLMSLAKQASRFGVDQVVTPPDTMVAAGPTGLLELVNRSVSYWSKTGSRLAVADLNTLLPLPAGYTIADPRVLYDAPSKRFFFSMNWGDSSNDSITFIGVTRSSNPLQGIFGYQLSPTTNGELHDQPKIGVTDDKVVIEWDDFMPGSVYAGTEIWVLQKSAMLAGAAVPMSSFGPTAGYLSAVPAQSLTPTTTAYAVHGAGTSAVVVQIDGTPANNNVVFTTQIVAMPMMVSPPQAIQPGGVVLNTGDNRFFSAVWRSGQLWVSGNTGCTQGFVERACMRVLELGTGSPITLTQSIDLSPSGFDAYYPAVVTDASGTLWVAFTASSATVFASAVAAEVTFPGSVPTPTYTAFMAGAQAFPGTLWGDYSAISIDPSTGAIWAAAEYAASGASGNWGTAAGQLGP